MNDSSIELLAPAKNYEYGVAAIDAGADAVYIGAPLFGARAGATNTLDDIERLVAYAHLFGVKVFVTLNTVLFDDELTQARSIAQSLADMGVDALIVQDMSYLMFGLDIPLHASTQSAALTPEKALFYQRAGFERVILERAMSLDDMRAIRDVTNVELEAFVHGAICVSFSGQCYMGQAVSGRSGNRGVCSQPCRSKYNLMDEKGSVIVRDKHLLSLLDLNLSNYIPQMIDCGVTSFKIEGRLKDITYLRNSVAYYRRVIDQVIAERNGLQRSSVGRSDIPFTPNPIKTFSRRYTSYFIEGNRDVRNLASLDTAKAVGEFVGEVIAVSGDRFKVKSDFEFNGGDGICFIDKWGNFGGTNINSSVRKGEFVELYPNVITGITLGAIIYRNTDKKFTDEILSAKIGRKIDVSITVSFDENGCLSVTAKDCSGIGVTLRESETCDRAKNIEKALLTLKTQLTKGGDTIFNVTDVEICGDICFMPVSRVNNIRREVLDRLREERLKSYKRNDALKISYPELYAKRLNYKANVTNKLAEEFYRKCGAEKITYGVECGTNYDGIELMTTRYCVRRELGECLREGGKYKKLFIENNGVRFELKFDCARCGMTIVKV